MKQLALTLILALTAFGALAAGDGKSCGQIDCYDYTPDIADKESLQRGAAIFVNYCMGCHEAAYSRYERVGTDLGIPPELVEANLIFDDTKIGSLMTNAMPEDAAKRWFGATPPDLTLVARSKGADWLYTYLLTFYEDPARPYGVNNLTFKDVGMPNVLAELQGTQKCLPGGDAEQSACGHIEHIADSGSQSPEEFEQTVRDLSNFMVYMAEPMALERKRLGIYVMFFLALLLVFAWLLNREYWKDVH